MSFTQSKKSSLISVPFLKKRIRRISGLGVHNLTVNEWNFSVYFTLHRDEKTVAFYTSESIENQRSPEWACLIFPSTVQCLQDFVLRVWIISSNHSHLFLEYDIHLDASLVPDEQKEKVTKGNNTLWLEIFGYRFTDSDDDDQMLSSSTKQRISITKSYDRLSIIRMNAVIHAIQIEKQESAISLEQLQTCLEMNTDYLSKIEERESRQLRINTLEDYLKFQMDLNQQRLMALRQRQRVLDERKYQLIRSLSQMRLQQEERNSSNNRSNQAKIILRSLTQIINYRQKEIINEIYRYIYPIEHENFKGFSIANVNLPQAEDKIYQPTSTRERDQEIGTAITFCSHFILLISQIIQLPLRFPIDYNGMATIKIYDYSLETNEFPLHPTTNLNAFRDGFVLLNRNLGQMMYHCRVGNRNTDFRNTLENLKALIEEYFIHSNTNNQIYLYPSLQATKSVNSTHEPSIPSKGNSFTSSYSSNLSFTESNTAEKTDVLPQLNPTVPRLAMESSQQIQY